MADCNRRGWVEDDQDWDNPCVCLRDAGHDGLHECGSGCGAEWAGGAAPEPSDSETGADPVCVKCGVARSLIQHDEGCTPEPTDSETGDIRG